MLHFALLSAPAVALADTLNIAAQVEPDALAKARKTYADGLTIEPFVKGHVEMRSHALYDSLRVNPGDELPEYLPMFIDSIGMHAIGSYKVKTVADTNMVRGAQLPPPQEFFAERIMLLFAPNIEPEDQTALFSWVWEFHLANKIVSRAPLALLPVTGHVSTLFNDQQKRQGPLNAAALRRNDLTIEPPYCAPMYKPIHIPALCQFQMVLVGPPFRAKGKIELYVVLDGQGIFAVQ